MLGAAATVGGCVEAVLVADLVINDCAGNLSLVLNRYIFQSYHLHLEFFQTSIYYRLALNIFLAAITSLDALVKVPRSSVDTLAIDFDDGAGILLGAEEVDATDGEAVLTKLNPY